MTNYFRVRDGKIVTLFVIKNSDAEVLRTGARPGPRQTRVGTAGRHTRSNQEASSAMTSTVSVGQFATMTHLSVKTLRHYHEVGLLEPARVDAQTGYRYYSLDQLPAAQLIRRLRDLKMPIADVRSVLVARDPDERNVLISAHMDRLEAELAETRAAVNSLRVLLDTARTRAPITRRTAPAFIAISIADTIDPGDVAPWWEAALAELRALARDQHLRTTGPAGGVFDEALYQQERAGPWCTSPWPKSPATVAVSVECTSPRPNS